MAKTILQEYCEGCGKTLGWVGTYHRSHYCSEGCRGGACTCKRMTPRMKRNAEEARRDAYRII